jgi:hypothetical protein
MSQSVEVPSPRQVRSAAPSPLASVAFTVAALLACGVAGVAPAQAQPRDPAGGEWLFREGRALMKKGDFLSACGKLEESLRLDPAVGTLMNLAECEERIGRTASAWQRWGAAADQLPSRDRRRETALLRARSLEKSLARLTVKLGPGAPPTAQVTRDGLVLNEPSLGVPLPVDPGIHWIVVTAPGREGLETEVRLAVGEQRVVPGAPTPVSRTVSRPVAPVSGAALIPPFSVAVASAPAAADQPAPRRSTTARAIGYVLVAGGAAGLASGLYFAGRALGARRDARDACAEIDGAHRCWFSAASALDDDRRWSLSADISFAAGALATGAGLYLLLRRPSGTAHAALVPAANGGRVELAGSF